MFKLSSLSLLALLALRGAAQDPSLLDKAMYCDEDCKKEALYAAKFERDAHAWDDGLLDDFYDTPAEFGPRLSTTPVVLACTFCRGRRIKCSGAPAPWESEQRCV